jgi:hypothetical protein
MPDRQRGARRAQLLLGMASTVEGVRSTHPRKVYRGLRLANHDWRSDRPLHGFGAGSLQKLLAGLMDMAAKWARAALTRLPGGRKRLGWP